MTTEKDLQLPEPRGVSWLANRTMPCNVFRVDIFGAPSPTVCVHVNETNVVSRDSPLIKKKIIVARGMLHGMLPQTIE